MKIISARPLVSTDLAALRYSTVGVAAARQMRAPLLAAFDVYKSNVAWGILCETEEEHKAVALWYRHLLDLDPVAFTAVPPAVAQYAEKGVIA